MSDWFWTWSGKSFGYRTGDSLFTHNGVEAGRFHGEEIYGADGAYLGEVKSERLITKTSKKSHRKGTFSPHRRIGRLDHVDRVGRVGHLGYEDFPDPETFE
jgi:hypothetical protein